MTRYKRRRKLIEPRIQMKFALTFFTTAGIAIFVQTTMIGFMIDRAARSLPSDGALLRSQLPQMLRDCFLLTALVLVPLTLVVGIRSTFRVIGPLHRFRLFLSGVLAGEQHAPCRIRAGDELHDFCDMLNRVTEPLRVPPEAGADVETAEPALPQPAATAQRGGAATKRRSPSHGSAAQLSATISGQHSAPDCRPPGTAGNVAARAWEGASDS
jgi:hypothetical protein